MSAAHPARRGVRSGLILLIGVLIASTAVIAGLIPAVASAAEFPVASGVSPGGVAWQIKAERRKEFHRGQYGWFTLHVHPSGHNYVGWGFGFPLPRETLPYPEAGLLVGRIGIDILHTEQNVLGGVARGPIRELKAKMSDGSTLKVPLMKAPETVREDHPWLRNFSVFETFYSHQLKPTLLRAYDADGQLLARFHRHYGTVFYWTPPA